MQPIPYGCCQCGCGAKAPIAGKTDTKRGYVKGRPRRFITGHNSVARDVADRFWEKVDRGAPDECWLWTSSTTGSKAAYGSFFTHKIHGRAFHKYAHRVAYELVVGPIPEGLELDHLCRTPRCVNPAHLEPVSHRENILRGETTPAKNARKTHCKRGHPLSGDSVRITKEGHRLCRPCRQLMRRANGY